MLSVPAGNSKPSQDRLIHWDSDKVPCVVINKMLTDNELPDGRSVLFNYNCGQRERVRLRADQCENHDGYERRNAEVHFQSSGDEQTRYSRYHLPQLLSWSCAAQIPKSAVGAIRSRSNTVIPVAIHTFTPLSSCQVIFFNVTHLNG